MSKGQRELERLLAETEEARGRVIEQARKFHENAKGVDSGLDLAVVRLQELEDDLFAALTDWVKRDFLKERSS